MERPLDPPSRIRALRRRLGLTQAALAARLGASYVSVNRWENGQTRPTALAWRRLLELEASSDPSPGRRVAEEPTPYDVELVLTPEQLLALAEASLGQPITFRVRPEGPPPAPGDPTRPTAP